MSQIHVDDIYDKTGSGRPEFPAGLTASGPVSIAGTLTYEDVTNVDAVGLVTARTGVRITAGGIVVTAGFSTLSDIKAGSGVTVLTSGNAEFVGIVTSNTCFKVGNGSFGPGIGVTITGDGNAIFSGITTVSTTAHVGPAITMNDSGINVSAGIITAKSLTYGSTDVETAIDTKTSTGKAIAMAMVFG